MKKHIYTTYPVAVIALLALFAVSSLGLPTGRVFQTLQIRPHSTMSEQFCPSDNLPVPVFRTETTTGTGKLVFQGCVAQGTTIPQARQSFGRESYKNRYDRPFAKNFRSINGD